MATNGKKRDGRAKLAPVPPTPDPAEGGVTNESGAPVEGEAAPFDPHVLGEELEESTNPAGLRTSPPEEPFEVGETQEATIARLSAELQAKAEELEELRVKQKMLTEHVETSEIRAQSAEDQLASQRAINVGIAAKHDALEAQIPALKLKEQEARSVAEARQTMIKNIQTEARDLRTELSEKTRILKEKEQDLLTATSQASIREERIALLEEQIDDLQSFTDEKFWETLRQKAGSLEWLVRVFHWLLVVVSHLRAVVIGAAVAVALVVISVLGLGGYALYAHRSMSAAEARSARSDQLLHGVVQQGSRYSDEEMNLLANRVDDAGHRTAYLLREQDGRVVAAVVPQGDTSLLYRRDGSTFTPVRSFPFPIVGYGDVQKHNEEIWSALDASTAKN